MLTILGLVVLAFASTAFASLGGDESSVQNDRVQMKAAKTAVVQTTQNYTVHEITTEAGTIKEFVSPQGTVFAVSWKGSFVPDLQQLLGSYYDQFRQAVSRPIQGRAVRSRGPLLIQQPGLVVQSGGHMRGYAGKAYLPDMLPQGVQPGDIQ
jgi:hypothetical protein